MKKPEKFSHLKYDANHDFYFADEMDAYISHLDQRIEKLEAARVEASTAMDWLTEYDLGWKQKAKEWLSKYGGES